MKFRKKSLLALALACVMAFSLLAGCGGNNSNTGNSNTGNNASSGNQGGDADTGDSGEKVVVLAQSADTNTMDPHRASGDIGANIYRNICESLTTFNNDDELIPLLAKSWEQLSDTEWLFYLEEGISFTNGEPFNAEAVIYNLDRAASTEYPRQSFEYTQYYDHCEAVDEYTVKIVLNSPDPLLPEHICDIGMLAPEHSAEIGEEANSYDICGTGPYILESWEADQQVTLVANKDYWRGEPQVDKYIIKTIPEAATRVAELLAGNVDIIYDVNFEDVPMLESQSNVHIDQEMTRRVCYIAFNTLDWSPAPELQDARVRQAMNYAVDVDAIVESIMGGFATPTATWYRSDFPNYDASIEGFEYNPEKAKELLAEAGYPDGFTIKCQVSDGLMAKSLEVTQAVAAYLEEVGIHMEVEPVEYSALRNILINGQDSQKAEGTFLWSWASKPGMVESWLTGIVHSTGMTSYNALPGYDELVDEILATVDLEEKGVLYEEFQHKLVEDPPYLYLFRQHSIYGISNRLNWSPSDYQYMLAYEMSVN